MLLQNMANLVVDSKKTYVCYGTNMQKMRRKMFFHTRFELIEWASDGKIKSSAYFSDLHLNFSPVGESLFCGILIDYGMLVWLAPFHCFYDMGKGIVINLHARVIEKDTGDDE